MTDLYSDFIVYVDESGDHSLDTIDQNYPYFVLAFCIFKKEQYIDTIVPALQQFKFEFFGHDMVVLHELEIRKSKPPFNFLLDAKIRAPFFASLNSLIENAPFTVIASVIDKKAHADKYGDNAHSPYDLSLLFCMERLNHLLTSENQAEATTHIILERRGKKEDNELELVFRRDCDNYKFNFEPVFAHKQNNSTGLQLADLVARPIGRHVMNERQANRAFELLSPKFYRYEQGYNGWGLKVFPK
jgi:uncharacterized protein DUF3800